MMSSPPSGGEDGRLQRCLRDLAALNALPSMCIGRTPSESLEIVMDALPTALAAELVVISLPGQFVVERASFGGQPLSPAELDELKKARDPSADAGLLRLQRFGELHYFQAEVPVSQERGVLLMARKGPLDALTDRMLLRSAANLVGTTLETAYVLEAAHRKDEFLAMLGHELRNPLAPIFTAVELLRRHPAAARERLVIGRHARHLARLVDDLLDISRVARGHMDLTNEIVRLESVLEQAVELVSPALKKQQHELHVDTAGDVLVRGDMVRLTQIFGNLLTNATKFTPAGGKIDVTVEPLPGRVRVTVRDTGLGIEPEALKRIFEPFVQAGTEREQRREGLGLGLAIVRYLVERHGGEVSARSEGLGRGAAISVELPVTTSAESRPAVLERPPARARAGARVLVVDDSTDVAELLAEALEDAGFATAIAFDARSALETWRRFRPHAAVLDVGLPDIDGYQLAAALRSEHGQEPILIAATGYGQHRDRLRAEAAGFDCHFVKPFSVLELLRVLDERVTLPVPEAGG